MQVTSCRMEGRNRTTVPVELSSLSKPPVFEITATENISTHGARIVTKGSWQAHQPVSLKSLQGDLRSQARVVYCETLYENKFAVGVELVSPVGSWKGWAVSPVKGPTEKNLACTSVPSLGSSGKTIKKIGIAAILLLIALLVFWPRNYAGRFARRPGTNVALDSKSGKPCRISGEKTPTAIEALTCRYNRSCYMPSDAAGNPIPRCSEIVEAQTHKEEVLRRFMAGILALFGIHIAIRHWSKQEA